MSQKLSRGFRLGVWLAVLCTVATYFFYPVNASEPGTLSEGSLAISPFIIEHSLKPGETRESAIEVYNLSNVPLPIAISINDFVPVGNNGSVRFLDSNEVANEAFSLAAWINILEQPSFTISPNDKTTVKFQIRVPVDAEPGTHYGGLLFSTKDKQPAVGNTTIIRKVGAIILVDTGQTDALGKIETFSSNKKFYTKPAISFSSTFANLGNVHLAPKGQVAIKNIFGQLIGESHLNPDGQFVLPNKTREFTDDFRSSWMLGRYTADLSFKYGKQSLETKARLVFWVIPIQTMLQYAGYGFGAFFLLYLLLRTYNRWVIKKSTK